MSRKRKKHRQERKRKSEGGNGVSTRQWVRGEDGEWVFAEKDGGKEVFRPGNTQGAIKPLGGGQVIKTTTTGYGGTTGYKECHKYGPIEVFKFNTTSGKEVTVWGGASRETDMATCDAVIDMGGMAYDVHYPTKGFRNAQSLLRKRSKPNQYIHVFTDDGRAPLVTREFWDALMADVNETSPHVLLCTCMGGHGRTGVALSIIAVLSGACPDGEDPVAWIRSRYCRKVVESDAQIKYIEKITGRKVTARPSDFFLVSYTSGYGGASFGQGTGYVDGKFTVVHDDDEEGDYPDALRGGGPGVISTRADVKPYFEFEKDDAEVLGIDVTKPEWWKDYWAIRDKADKERQAAIAAAKERAAVMDEVKARVERDNA
jgi:hypothetical protein